MNLEGKVAIVTGGTGGLGWRICKKLSACKMKIVLVYLNSKDKAEEYAAELKKNGGDVLALSADITTEGGINSMMNSAISTFGGVDALVLDAAFNQFVKFSELENLTPKEYACCVALGN